LFTDDGEELIDKNQFEIGGETASWNSSRGFDYEDDMQQRFAELTPGKYKLQIIRYLMVNLKTPHPLTGVLRWEETSEEIDILATGTIDITVLP
jgi:hypothetical protein